MALATSYKMLFRRGGSTSSILTIMLLVAMITSTNAIVNYLNLQSETLASLVNTSGTYLILSSNSTALTDSKLDMSLAERITSLSYIKYAFPQKMLTASITTNSGTSSVQVMGVADVSNFLKTRNAYISGTAAKNIEEADVGEILANALSIDLGDRVSLALNNRHVEIEVVGVFRSQTQSDTELVIPMQTANMLSGNNNTISVIEFSLKQGVDSQQALSKIIQLLPGNARLVQAQQIKEFTEQINMQTLTFLNVWSLAVYAVVAVASYIIATRLITETSYELSMLRALGAKKHLVFTLVVTYTALVAFAGSILGAAMGTVGTQIASTVLGWFSPGIAMAPFLLPEQALQTIALTLSSSILGCIYPALKSAQIRYVELQL